jgi:hypothetical protein
MAGVFVSKDLSEASKSDLGDKSKFKKQVLKVFELSFETLIELTRSSKCMPSFLNMIL